MSQLKIECARRQLGTALDLYLRDLDPISVHCLANGGCELIEFYAKKAGAEPFVSHVLKKTHLDIKGIKRMKTIQRQDWNAFKHATTKPFGGGKERKDDQLLSTFTDKQNDLAQFIGWADYFRATKTMPIEAHMFQLWFIALHPEKRDPKHARELTEFQKLFPGLRMMQRAEQKKELNRVIKWARTNNALISDPRTDPRPLILDWCQRTLTS